MSDAESRVAASYVQDARADLQLAELAMSTGNRLGAEHLYRAAEKLVKAIRVSRGLDATKEHDLEQLPIHGQERDRGKRPQGPAAECAADPRLDEALPGLPARSRHRLGTRPQAA